MKAVLTATLLAVGIAAAGCGSSGSEAPAVVPPPSSGRVAPEHVLAAAQVQVVAYRNGDVWICPPYVDGGVYGPPSAPNCRGGLRAVGVRVSALHSHLEGVRWGLLHLVGVYRDGTFRVTAQGPWRVAPNPPSPFEAPIPCAAPAGGWRLVAPAESQRNTIDAYQRQHRGDLVSVAFFHDGTVLTVASTHPARTRALLGPSWPSQLCVVRARYSRPFVNRVRAMVLGLMQPGSRAARYGWVTGAGGYGVNARGQTTISLDVLIVTPALQAFLRRQPPGVVAVDAVLRPVR